MNAVLFGVLGRDRGRRPVDFFRSDPFCVASHPLPTKIPLRCEQPCADDSHIVHPTSHRTSARSATSSPAACCGCGAAVCRWKIRKPPSPETFAYTSRPPSAVMRTPREREPHETNRTRRAKPTRNHCLLYSKAGRASPACRLAERRYPRLEGAVAQPLWHGATAL